MPKKNNKKNTMSKCLFIKYFDKNYKEITDKVLLRHNNSQTICLKPIYQCIALFNGGKRMDKCMP
ncbi:MAG: hypothetical protein HKUEN01_10060 [Candidatus Kuenenia stuttgartiensis]|nr:MAG: hypothetical protein HKUEN01_10060 [Candidatus Kuenenia stuttgartiensis]